MASHGSSESRARVEQLAALSPQERQDLLMQAFARVRQLQQHPFRNRKEINYAIGDLLWTVTGESSAHMNELTTICKGLYEHGRVKDPQTEKELATFDDPREWFQGFWAATFRSIVQAIDEAKRTKGLGLDDVAYRMFIVNDRTYQSAKEYLDEKGWDDQFGSTMSFLLHNNLRAAAETPKGQPMPEGGSLQDL